MREGRGRARNQTNSLVFQDVSWAPDVWSHDRFNVLCVDVPIIGSRMSLLFELVVNPQYEGGDEETDPDYEHG